MSQTICCSELHGLTVARTVVDQRNSHIQETVHVDASHASTPCGRCHEQLGTYECLSTHGVMDRPACSCSRAVHCTQLLSVGRCSAASGGRTWCDVRCGLVCANSRSSRARVCAATLRSPPLDACLVASLLIDPATCGDELNEQLADKR